MRDFADTVSAPAFQKLVAATTEPFVQAILDLGVPQMVFGRVALVADAGFIPRPHTAASTSKAAANAIALSLGTVPGERRENGASLDSVTGSAIAPSCLTAISRNLRMSRCNGINENRLNRGLKAERTGRR